MIFEKHKKKVLIIQSMIPPYRVPIFNQLSKFVDLTIVYDTGNVPDDVMFATMKIEVTHLKHMPHIHKKNLLLIAKKFDVVICMLTTSYLINHFLCRFRGNTKVIFWGIGVAAGYGTRYDSVPEVIKGLEKMIQCADAALFYSDYPVEKYGKMGIAKEKMFVAPNTVAVLPIECNTREKILFVGSLYKAKKIFELIEYYYQAYKKNNNIPSLTLIGDGEDYEGVYNWIKQHDMTGKIELTGAIFDEKILAKYFSKAILCISPDQAGLSVLKSFGYGVPFATHKDAITGGERFNIVDGENGILFDSFESIENIILDITDNKQKYIEMGERAKKYYQNSRKIDDMVKGFLDAIGYVLGEKIF